MVQYYRQRASAGLIITEGVPISKQAVGYHGVPGIWSDEQVGGWKAVTRAVKQAGGLIFMQIWHVGRVSDPVFHEGREPVGASPIAAGGHVSLLRPERPYVVPRALTTKEVEGVIESFRQAAQFAQEAGFDGVELHGANGYLLDQFLQDSTNQRADEFGGPIENRARLMLSAADAAISVWGASRVGMHLAPHFGMGREPRGYASRPQRRRSFDGRLRSRGDLRICCARAWPPTDCLHLRTGAR